MCGRFTLRTPANVLVRQFALAFEPELRPRYNIAPTQDVPVVRSSGESLERALEIENEVSVAVLTSKDAREGPRAFKEKRKPRFTGE